MLHTLEDIRSAIRTGAVAEHRNINVELKESWAKECGKKVSALANKHAVPKAWVLVGIDDSGRLIGQNEQWARHTEQAVSQQFNEYLDPTQACAAIHCVQEGTAWFVAIELVPPGAIVKWENRAYKAAGTTQAEMSPEEVLELTIRLPGLADYSKQPWQGQCEPGLISEFCNQLDRHRKGDPAIEQLVKQNATDALRQLGIHGKHVARLLFGSTSFRFVVVDATGHVVKNDQRSGLWRILGETMVNEIQDESRKLRGISDEPYSPLALREALANMVAHAAYFERDAEIIIEVTPDSLSLANLCLPELGFFANRWFSRGHKSPNALLMEVLRLAGRVDELGRGKTLIFRESLLGGRRPPKVFIEPAGLYSRWKLVMHGGAKDQRSLRLLNRLRALFQDERRALIALALVFWRNESVSEIRKYVDDEFQEEFVDVLEDLRGPVFFNRSTDRLWLGRWAEILLGKGKDSKRLSDEEETRVFQSAYRFHTRFTNGVMTNEDFRKRASMGDTASERALASTILSEWLAKGLIDRVGRRGKFKFRPQPTIDAAEVARERAETLRRIFGKLATNL